jgi:hypothetical protein
LLSRPSVGYVAELPEKYLSGIAAETQCNLGGYAIAFFRRLKYMPAKLLTISTKASEELSD